MTDRWDAVIIGAGTAGLSAAQMLGRSRRRTLVIDEGNPRNRFAAHMHGVLGHDGVSPRDLLARGRAEAESYDVEFVEGSVTHIGESGEGLRITRKDGTIDEARVVVLTTGVRDDLPDIPGLADGWGRTVLHCPYCHGWEVAGRRLGVLATSAASTHQVQLVRQLSPDVTLFASALGEIDEETSAGLIGRGIRVLTDRVREVRPRGEGLSIVMEDGVEHEVDALFTGGALTSDLGFADDLALARSDQSGATLAVDMRGMTSHPRVFAAGNVVSPFANVPVSMGAGAMAGAGANAALVEDDVARAVTARAAARHAAWEERYAAEERRWSGRVNGTTAGVVETLAPGRALDVGSGEGGDAVWLAERGWTVTGVDVAATAVDRAAELAREHGVDVRFIVGDGAASVEGAFDLVLASFLHSEEEDFPRIRMLRDAASRVAPGGLLLIVSHAAPPPWSHALTHRHPPLRTPADELALLALDPAEWEAEIVEIRQREVVAPDGQPAALDDGVLLLRRSA